jgi:chemotaxis protein MotB
MLRQVPQIATHATLSVLAVVGFSTTGGCVSLSRYEALDQKAKTLQQERSDDAQRFSTLQTQSAELERLLDETKADSQRVIEEHDTLDHEFGQFRETTRAKEMELIESLGRLKAAKALLETELADQNKDELEREAKFEQAAVRVKMVRDHLVASFTQEMQAGQVEVGSGSTSVTVSIDEALLFDAGRARLTGSSRDLLKRLAQAVAEFPDEELRVEGSTDGEPIGGLLKNVYPTSWELAAARAVNVVRFLEEHCNIDPQRLSAASYGQSRLSANTDTPVGRSKSGRLEVVLMSADAERPPVAAK